MSRRGEETGGAEGGDRRSSAVTARDAMLVSLSLAAGCVDAVGYLGLGRVFVANMTGNTVLLGLAVGQWEWEAALRAGTALAAFIGGVAAGVAILDQDRDDREVWPPIVTLALALELLVLVAFAVGWGRAAPEPDEGATYVLICLSSLAMGVQSAAVRRLGVPGVATTYITGTLTNLTEEAIARLRSASPGRGSQAPGSRPSARGLVLPADVWLAYGLGAVLAGAIVVRQPSLAVVPSVIVLAAVVTLGVALHRRLGE
jgi:uncharacterized membrane protein YoaK (UPF0700 family)